MKLSVRFSEQDMGRISQLKAELGCTSLEVLYAALWDCWEGIRFDQQIKTPATSSGKSYCLHLVLGPELEAVLKNHCIVNSCTRTQIVRQCLDRLYKSRDQPSDTDR